MFPASVYFYRDRDGGESDLLFDVDGRLWLVEIKHAATPRRDWQRPFAALARLGKPTGPGAVLCLASEALPLTRDITALPKGVL
jgi:predicted AAA+ superfamily ATPase